MFYLHAPGLARTGRVRWVAVARPHRKTPAEHFPDGAWPDGATDDPAARVAAAFASRLRTAAAGRSYRQLEAVTGVDHTAIAKTLTGATWPDLATIAKLEHGLDTDLWPGRATEAHAPDPNPN